MIIKIIGKFSLKESDCIKERWCEFNASDFFFIFFFSFYFFFLLFLLFFSFFSFFFFFWSASFLSEFFVKVLGKFFDLIPSAEKSNGLVRIAKTSQKYWSLVNMRSLKHSTLLEESVIGFAIRLWVYIETYSCLYVANGIYMSIAMSSSVIYHC